MKPIKGYIVLHEDNSFAFYETKKQAERNRKEFLHLFPNAKTVHVIIKPL